MSNMLCSSYVISYVLCYSIYGMLWLSLFVQLCQTCYVHFMLYSVCYGMVLDLCPICLCVGTPCLKASGNKNDEASEDDEAGNGDSEASDEEAEAEDEDEKPPLPPLEVGVLVLRLRFRSVCDRFAI